MNINAFLRWLRLFCLCGIISTVTFTFTACGGDLVPVQLAPEEDDKDNPDQDTPHDDDGGGIARTS